MSYSYDAYDACYLLGIDAPRTRKHIYIRCPWCNSKGKCLNINLVKGVYRCNKNDEHKGSVTEFYANLRGFQSTKDAARDIRKNLGKESISIVKRTSETTTSIEEEKAADIDSRNKVYQALFLKMPLTSMDKENLLGRGFTLEEIKMCGYASLPKMDFSDICNLIEWLLSQKLNLEKVPGFFTTSKKHIWLFNAMKAGIMMPNRDINNKIQCIQVRKRDSEINFAEREGKCYYLTSRYKENGASASQAIHFAGEFETLNDGSQRFINKNGIVVLIEGIMKADLFYCLTKQQAIAVPGVQCQKALSLVLPDLKELGIHTIMVAFDMDSVLNINVLEGLIHIETLIEEAGFHCSTLEWSVAMKRLNGTDYSLNRDTDFVFTVESYDAEVEAERLDQTFSRILKAKRKKIIFALKNSKEANEENFQKLQNLTKVATTYDLIVDVMFWDLKLKGIDNYYAYKIRNIHP